MFYTFDQNNSGGSFDQDLNAGIGHTVIVEADSAAEANESAKKIGIYFDGVSCGMDCDCCGDRWYETRDADGTELPSIYGEPLNKYLAGNKGFSYRFPIFIHFKDGRIGRVDNPLDKVQKE